MPFQPSDLLIAWLLDALLGDPRWLPWPHPVVLMGRACARLESRLRAAGDTPTASLLKGAALWVAVVGGSFVVAWTGLSALGWLHPLAQRAAAVYLAYACLATRSLDREVRAVASLVEGGRLQEAQRQVARVVGRDTEGLAAPEILRAATETAAENSSDGVIAPLFFLALGGALGFGPLLGLAYKAVNTLDSMVGYRDERYEHFGKVSARVDDVANFVPARLTALLVSAAAGLAGEEAERALAVARRDGRLHKSPNSGYAEAAFAGALGIQLGGTNWYQGVPRVSPRIGDPGEALTPAHVRRALRLLWLASLLAALAGAVVLWVV